MKPVPTFCEENMKYITILMGVLIGSTYLVDKLPDVKLTPLPMSEPTPVEQFIDRISQMESGGNHKIVNRFGMMGKYQFSMVAVRTTLGSRVSREQFLRNPELQDTAMVRLLKIHEGVLEPIIAKYDGKTFKGIKINRASILAGAHFAGAGGVINFFKSNSRTGTVDANGTSLKYYMSKFSNFNLPSLRSS